MSYGDLYIAERTMDGRVQERRRDAEARHQAQRMSRRQQQTLSRRARWLLCQLGYRLVELGAWLEGYGTLPARSVEAH